MVSKPEDFYFRNKESSFSDSLKFLVQARQYVSNQDVPEDIYYAQMVHSDDKHVGDDIHKPAILDASYAHFNRKLLSISVPEFTPVQDMVTITPKKMNILDQLK